MGISLAGWAIILFAAGLAHFIQTSSDVKIEDIRFKSANGKTLSALLYLPANATAENKAPAILTVHGYINSRKVQSGFAIVFARRGWAVLAAAAAMPDGYRSVILQGSSTGPPFAVDGTPTWPRIVAVAFTVDVHFCFVGLKAMSLAQLQLALIYVVPFLIYFIGVLWPLLCGLSVERDGWLTLYTSNTLALMGGFLLFLMAQYVYLFSTGTRRLRVNHWTPLS